MQTKKYPPLVTFAILLAGMVLGLAYSSKRHQDAKAALSPPVKSSAATAGSASPQSANAAATNAPSDQVDIMNARLRMLAGADAVDCGTVQIRQDPSAATNCALGAFAMKDAFYVRYYIQGIDSAVAGGLAYDKKGNMSALDFDSMGWASEGLSKGSRLADGNHIIVKPCPLPVALHKSHSGRLTCFPPDPKATRNLMSPEAESW